jgi:hypothetical protein
MTGCTFQCFGDNASLETRATRVCFPLRNCEHSDACSRRGRWQQYADQAGQTWTSERGLGSICPCARHAIRTKPRRNLLPSSHNYCRWEQPLHVSVQTVMYASGLASIHVERIDDVCAHELQRHSFRDRGSITELEQHCFMHS